MADPEIPEVRAELQRKDRPQARPGYDKPPPRLGARAWLWAAFLLIVIAIIVAAYSFA